MFLSLLPSEGLISVPGLFSSHMLDKSDGSFTTPLEWHVLFTGLRASDSSLVQELLSEEFLSVTEMFSSLQVEKLDASFDSTLLES
jgi:hypothetical protein